MHMKLRGLSASATNTRTQARPLERDSVISLYLQIAERLKHDIDSGLYANGNKLPTESELTQRFDVSRVTVRQAIAQLLAEGYVVSKQGKGTYVSQHKFLHDLKPLRGFYDTLVAQGIEPQTRVLEFGQSDAPEAVAKAFGMAQTAEGQCCCLKRLYLVDDEPMTLVWSYLPPEASKLTADQVDRNPIYAMLENLLGLAVARADIRIRAQTAGTAIGKILGLSRTAAVLVMERESFGIDGQLREHTSFFMRPENYEFTLSVQGKLPIGSSIKNTRAPSLSSTPSKWK
jgi:GntR family transcriptional regulator